MAFLRRVQPGAGVQVSLVGLFGLAMAAFNLKGLSVLFSAVSFFSLLVQIALVGAPPGLDAVRFALVDQG